MADKQETERRIEVMQAFVDDENIEVRRKTEMAVWYSVGGDPSWNWSACDFRVKPKPREFWINIYPQQRYSFATYNTKKEADAYALQRSVCIKVREVVDA